MVVGDAIAEAFPFFYSHMYQIDPSAYGVLESSMLNHVASGIGKPLFANSVTEEQMRLGYARVLVEVNMESKYPRFIDLDVGGGKMIIVAVEYP